MKFLLLAIALITLSAKGQDIPCHANTIILPAVSFNKVCTALLDSGYIIDKKDNDLLTASTQPRSYPKRFSATYVINVRMKDSAAYFTVMFNAPKDGSIVKNEPSIYKCKKNGKPVDNIFTYPFWLVNSFAIGLGKVEYKTN
jgi:hypothetical protein